MMPRQFNNMKKILISILVYFAFFNVNQVFAAQQVTVPIAPGVGYCLTSLASGLWNPTLVCASGGGGGGSGGTWSTTTSNVLARLINYPNNSTDIVVIGSRATTTAPFYFDPNTLTSVLNGLTTVNRITATGTIASIFPYASTTAFTATNAYITALANLTGNGFVKTSGGLGTLSIDTNTYLTGNQTVTLTGDVTGSGATAITTTYNNTVPINKGGTGLTSVGASSTVLITNGTADFWQKLATSQLTNDSGFLTATSTLTNNNTFSGVNQFSNTASTSFGGPISFTYASSTATSTMAGINLPYGGCFAVAGTCITTSSGGSGLTFAWPFTPQAGGVSTTSTMYLYGGLTIGVASSTFNGLTSFTASPTFHSQVNVDNNINLEFGGGSGNAMDIKTGTDGTGVIVPGLNQGLKLGTGCNQESCVDGIYNQALNTALFSVKGGTGNATFIGTLNVSTTTATSTFANGIEFTGGTIKLDKFPNCNGTFNLETDSSGNISCGADASSTLLIDNNAFAGINQFTNAATTSFTGRISMVSASTTATSTFAGINLPYGGCYAILGSCITGGTGGSGTVTSVATNNGLTGGTITNTGTIGLDISALSSGALDSWNGTRLAATGTPSLTVGYLIATSSTAQSQIAGQLTIGGLTPLTQSSLYIGSSTNNYIEANIQNTNSGNNASAIFTVTNDKGNANAYFGEFGINGSTYNQALFSGQGASDVFLGSSDSSLDLGAASSTGGNASSSINFFTSGWLIGNKRMTIDSAGNVGIGTTTLSQLLGVQGNILASGNIVGANLTATGTIKSLSTTATSSFAYALLLDQATGGVSVCGNPWLQVGSSTCNLDVDKFSGNVGIGSSTPTQALSIVGNVELSGNITELGAATSTYVNGINIAGGCFSINNVCVGAVTGGGSGTVLSGLAGQLGYYNTAGTTLSPTSTNPLYLTSVYATSTAATSTLLGGVVIGNNCITFDPSVSTTTLACGVVTGNSIADNDAGLETLYSLSVVNAAFNTPEGYDLEIGGQTALQIICKAGIAGCQAIRVGVGTTSPYAQFEIFASSTNDNLFQIVSAASTTLYRIDKNGVVNASSTAPTVSSGVVDGTNMGGWVNGCSSACTLTFANGGWVDLNGVAHRPECGVGPETGSIVNTFSYVVTATTIVVTETGLGNWDYHCGIGN